MLASDWSRLVAGLQPVSGHKRTSGGDFGGDRSRCIPTSGLEISGGMSTSGCCPLNCELLPVSKTMDRGTSSAGPQLTTWSEVDVAVQVAIMM